MSETTKKPPYKLIKLGDGTAVSFLPEHKGIAAIVDLNTLQRISRLLGNTSLGDIKDEFIGKIEESGTMEEFTEVIAKELAFHSTFNNIKKIDLFMVTNDIQAFEKPVQEEESIKDPALSIG